MYTWRVLGKIWILGSSPSKKGLWGLKGQKPLIYTRNRNLCFFTTKKAFQFALSCAARPKILSKKKKVLFESAFRGRSLLQSAPAPHAERTAYNASRKCVSFFGIPDLECFISCEKAYESVPCANKGLCPFETCKSFLPDKLALRICYANSIRKIK